jgi:hypothetical protein
VSLIVAWFASLFLSAAQPDMTVMSEPSDPPTEDSGRVKFGGGTTSSERPTVSP